MIEATLTYKCPTKDVRVDDVSLDSVDVRFEDGDIDYPVLVIYCAVCKKGHDLTGD